MESWQSRRVIELFLAHVRTDSAFYTEDFERAMVADLHTFSAEPPADPTGGEALAAAGRVRIPAIVIAQSGHRDRGFRAS